MGIMPSCDATKDVPLDRKDERAKYIETIKSVSDVGVAVSRTYQRALRYDDESSQIRELDKIISRTRRAISDVEALQSPSDLTSTHREYLRGWNLLLQGFLKVRQALDLKYKNTDEAVLLLREANGLFDESQLVINDVADELGF